MSVVCCLCVSVAGRSLVHRDPTECGVPDCDLETSIMRFRPTSAVEPWREKTSQNVLQKKKKNKITPIFSHKITEILFKKKNDINPYPTAFPYGNGMVLYFYQQQESSTTKSVNKVINKRLKTYV